MGCPRAQNNNSVCLEEHFHADKKTLNFTLYTAENYRL